MNAAVLLLLLSAPHAPAPFLARPSPPAFAGGVVVMTWRGVEADTGFMAGSHYWCVWHGTWYHGEWACEGGVLTVTEWPMWTARHGERSTWSARLSCPASGVMPCGAAWSVRPLPGRVR